MMVAVDDLPKIALLILVVFLALTGLWAAVDKRSRAAAVVRRAWSGRWRRLILMTLSLAIFAVIAEDVVSDERDEVVLKVDRQVQTLAGHLTRSVRTFAHRIGWWTGAGLVIAVVLVTGGLALRRRWRDAWIVLLGTVSAWGLSGILKITFGIPRPRWSPGDVDVSYGFPSGHALVTLVACALIARALGHGRSSRVRIALLAGAWGLTLITGIARVISKAHWTSDVVAGFALGAAWANIVTVVAESSGMLSDADSARDAGTPSGAELAELSR
jgi:undecaprenyl-diphosphatase